MGDSGNMSGVAWAEPAQSGIIALPSLLDSGLHSDGNPGFISGCDSVSLTYKDPLAWRSQH